MKRRIVIKIGSNVLAADGRLEEHVLASLVRDIALLKKAGTDVVVVTSGAVAVGRGIMGREFPSSSVIDRQLLAAVGQPGLMDVYARLFRAEGLKCAQVLATKNDFRDREHYANMKACFENLLASGIVPVANENDTVAIKELGFSDNDELASLIGSQLNAELVLFLSTVDGVLTEENGVKRVIGEIDEESIASVARHITSERSAHGTGGMESKFKLARKLMNQGITAVIANGTRGNVVSDIAAGSAVGTKFIPKKKVSAVKRRLAHANGLAKGIVYVNAGAEEALLSKTFKSLLPVGVVKVEGNFEKGDTVEIRNGAGKKIGSGVAQLGSAAAAKAAGVKGGKALVHYDYLFIGD